MKKLSDIFLPWYTEYDVNYDIYVILKWCNEKIGKFLITWSLGTLAGQMRFADENDAVFFELTWG